MIKSNLDEAFDLVKDMSEPVAFADLWKMVCEKQGYSEEVSKSKVGKFYTALSLDGRFITVGENKWDLRDRYTFDKAHINMNDVYACDEMVNDDDQAEQKSEGEESDNEEENPEDEESEDEESDSEPEEF